MDQSASPLTLWSLRVNRYLKGGFILALMTLASTMHFLNARLTCVLTWRSNKWDHKRTTKVHFILTVQLWHWLWNVITLETRLILLSILCAVHPYTSVWTSIVIMSRWKQHRWQSPHVCAPPAAGLQAQWVSPPHCTVTEPDPLIHPHEGEY